MTASLLICAGIQREEEKVKRSLREAAKKGDKDVCLILAKEILHARKAISKIYTSKAHINSISMQMKNQLGVLLKLSVYTIHICFLLYTKHKRENINVYTYK